MNAFTTKEYTAYYTPAAGPALPARRRAARRRAHRARRCATADVDSERQVILEELAMDDDTPDDVAHTLLSEALFPDHPLGRETAGDARDRRAPSPPTTSASSSAAGTGPRRWSWRSPAPSTTTTSWPRWRGASPTPRRRRPAPARRAPDAESRPAGRRRRRRTEQAHVALGCRARRPRRPRPRGARRRQPRASAAACRAGCSRRSASSAGLAYAVYSGDVRVRRRRRPDHLRRHRRPASVDEVLDLIEVELDKLRGRRPHRRRAGRGQRLPHRLLRAGPRGHRRAAWPASARLLDDDRRASARWPSRSTAGGPSPPTTSSASSSGCSVSPRSLAVVGPVSEAAVRGRRRAARPA